MEEVRGEGEMRPWGRAKGRGIGSAAERRGREEERKEERVSD